jgi:SH3-like domain-containing protein
MPLDRRGSGDPGSNFYLTKHSDFKYHSPNPDVINGASGPCLTMMRRNDHNILESFNRLDKSDMMKPYSIFLVVLIVIMAGTAMAERLCIVAPIANIRSGPDTKSDILWKVEKYYPIMVIKKSEQWYQFRDFEEDLGWVHKSLVGKVKAVITKKDNCNVRLKPGTKEKILFTIEKGIPFKVLKSKGRWLNVEHADGDRGWIHDSLVW